MPYRSEIRQFIVDNFMYGQQTQKFADDASFLENGIIDSTGVLELVAFVEQKFGVSVADEDLVPANLDSVDNLVGYITRKKEAAG
jgi:acyl carrier protein